jgi:hypothetical protein
MPVQSQTEHNCCSDDDHSEPSGEHHERVVQHFALGVRRRGCCLCFRRPRVELSRSGRNRSRRAQWNVRADRAGDGPHSGPWRRRIRGIPIAAAVASSRCSSRIHGRSHRLWGHCRGVPHSCSTHGHGRLQSPSHHGLHRGQGPGYSTHGTHGSVGGSVLWVRSHHGCRQRRQDLGACWRKIPRYTDGRNRWLRSARRRG